MDTDQTPQQNSTSTPPEAPAQPSVQPATNAAPDSNSSPAPQAAPPVAATPTPPVNEPATPAASQVNPNPTPTQPTVSAAPVRPQPTPSEPEKKSSGVLSFIVTIVIALVLTQFINLFFFQSYRVFGSSMYSTLHDGDRLIVNKIPKTTTKITHKTFQPKRGQIIVFTSPKDPTLQLVKRVIGLPGERVVVKDGKITVYNSEHADGFNPDDADYGKNLPVTSGEADVTVPEGQIFVSGDNRAGSNSLDSRNELGTVPENLIIGVVSVRLWPIQNARFF